VKEFIEKYETEACCADCEITSQYTVTGSNIPKARYQALHDMMGAILYSSGFWSKFSMSKNQSDWQISRYMKRMTPEEKENAHRGMDLD